MTKRMLELRPPNGGVGTIVVGYVGPLEGWLALVDLLRSEGYVEGGELVADTASEPSDMSSDSKRRETTRTR